MLRYVAPGPFPPRDRLGRRLGAALGLAVHFALMAIMATVYIAVARRMPMLRDGADPVAASLYGVATYVVMNWSSCRCASATVFRRARVGIATQLASTLLLVGIPIALIAAASSCAVGIRAGMTAGYSRHAAGEKLALKPGMRTWWDGMPDSVARGDRRDRRSCLLPAPEAPIDAAHIFVTDARRHGGEAAGAPAAARARRLHLGELAEEGVEGRRPTSPRTASARSILPDTDLVDVKVCAVDAVWSGLKLMIRRSAR